MSTPLTILKQVFGHDRFLGPQEAIIRHVLAGGDAVVLLPTGGGKSLCYQIPALLRPGTAIVISPLIALMRDQVQALTALGVAAGSLHSAQTAAERRSVEERLRDGRLDILYIAPERFMIPAFQDMLSGLPLALFAIDEAHCVSQWGHDFRPEYLQLAVIAERFPGVPRLALTATADGPTRADILSRLRLDDARVFATGFDRPNIRYLVEPKDHPKYRLLRFLTEDHPGQSGIVYRLSRKKVEGLADWLTAQGVPALAYHAGLNPAERDSRQDRFMREEGLVMVATVAFGMGVDKPDVRFVVHFDPPKSLEAYHQETGRAGRDGAPAEALMLYGEEDFVALRSLLLSDGANGPQQRITLAKLKALVTYCESDVCRRRTLLGYFGEDLAEPCGNCDICLDPVEAVDVTVAAQKALSCVYRTGQRFGAAHVADVLLGKQTARVERFGHAALSTFGIGGELSERQWRAVMRRLEALGALESDETGHGLLLTATAWDFLKGRRGLTMRLPRDPERSPGRRPRRSGSHRSWVDDYVRTPEERLLWERLRAWRSATAKAAEVPPYVVFHDRTLLDIVLQKPQDLAGLAAIGGMGQAKLDTYGQTLLEMLQEHYAAYGPGESRPPLPAGTVRPSRGDVASVTARQSLELYRDLGSVAAVAERRGLKSTTVYAHLLPFVRRGELAARQVAAVTEAEQAEAEAALVRLRQQGADGMTPVYDALGGRIPYEALRCLEAGLWAEGRLGKAAAPSSGVTPPVA